MRLPASAVVAAIVAVATILPAPVKAFAVFGYTWVPATMAYYVNPTNMQLPTANVLAAVRAGADAWHAQSGTPFTFVYAGLSSQTTNTNDGLNVVMFRNAASGSALATTYGWFSGSRFIDADIVFWDSSFAFATGTGPCSNAYYIDDIAAHEFGHALGLDHSAIASATMYFQMGACSMQNRTLDPDDISAVLSLYPHIAVAPPAPKNLRIIGGL